MSHPPQRQGRRRALTRPHDHVPPCRAKIIDNLRSLEHAPSVGIHGAWTHASNPVDQGPKARLTRTCMCVGLQRCRRTFSTNRTRRTRTRRSASLVRARFTALPAHDACLTLSASMHPRRRVSQIGSGIGTLCRTRSSPTRTTKAWGDGATSTALLPARRPAPPQAPPPRDHRVRQCPPGAARSRPAGRPRCRPTHPPEQRAAPRPRRVRFEGPKSDKNGGPRAATNTRVWRVAWMATRRAPADGKVWSHVRTPATVNARTRYTIGSFSSWVLRRLYRVYVASSTGSGRSSVSMKSSCSPARTRQTPPGTAKMGVSAGTADVCGFLKAACGVGARAGM